MWRRILNKRYNGGALYYVIFVSFILSAIVLLFLLLRSLACKSLRQELDYYQKIDNLNSAITLYLSKPEQFQKTDSTLIFPLKDSSLKVSISKSSWGLYDKLTANTGYRGKILSRTLLTGYDPWTSDSIALWIPENNQTLYASGATKIVGNVHLPQKGIQRASIEGKPLESRGLISGKIFKSESILPSLPLPVVNKIHACTNIDSLRIIGEDIFKVNDETLNNSFHNNTRWLTSKSDIELSDLKLDSNVGIISNGAISIKKDSKLDRTILSCNKIRIEDGFKGSVQIFARDSIIIGKNCHFDYPSVICLYNENVNIIYCEIGAETIVEGAIIVSQTHLSSKKPFLKINQDAKVTGQVYHKGTIELYGSISGSLYCEDFYLKTSRAFYINHLLDNTIDYLSLPKEIALIDFSSGYSTQIIDFLYEEL